MNFIDRYFELTARQTNIKKELIAGLTTFMAMSYILFVNPSMLAQTGMDHGAVFVATCLAAAFGSIAMGMLANLPVALAPGMGLNAFFTYVIVLEQGHSWQTALAAVFCSGVLFLLLSIFKIREWIIQSIPFALKMGIAAGIGMFLALIALKTANIIVASPATLVTLGDLHDPKVLLAIAGFFLIFALAHRKQHAAVFISILVITAIAWWRGDTSFTGVVAMPPSLAPTFLQLDFASVLQWAMVPVVLSLLFLDLFDTSGTLVAVSQRAGLLKPNGEIPRLKGALLADSSATIAGALVGTSTTTSYVESTAGVAAGGRTGLTAVVVGLAFLAALWLSPLAAMVPAYATAGALLYVATLMLSSLQHVHWDDLIESVPVVVVLVMMPLTFSIADGIGMGFITYAVLCLVTGRLSKTTLSVWVLTAILLLNFSLHKGRYEKITILLALMLSTAVVAEDKVQVTSTELAPHLYMIKGAGGNMAAVVGPEGALVVDSQYEHVAPLIKAELERKQAGMKIKTLINTHFHGDHVNGNAALASGAQIIAHTNVLTRLKADAKFPVAGLPTETFIGEKAISLNGVNLKLVTMPVSHTDGDLVVWFKDANVLHTGDLFFADRFPFIDLKSGGSVTGYISNVKLLLSQIDDKTRLIPGHGDLMDKAGLQRFLSMMEQTLAEVNALKAQGKTEDQIVTQGLSAQWKSWSWNFITEERWIRTLFKA